MCIRDRNNGTPVQSQSERDKTVAGNEGGSGRPSEGWNSRGVSSLLTVWRLPIDVYKRQGTTANASLAMPTEKQEQQILIAQIFCYHYAAYPILKNQFQASYLY